METMETRADGVVTDEARRGDTGPSRLMMALAIALAVVVIAALVVSVFEWQHYENRANHLSTVADLSAGALKAAEAYGVDVGSYNYADLHGPTASWTQIEDHSTPAFRTKYESTTGDLQSTVTAYKATAQAKVTAGAVSSVKGSQAVVLIELDQTITNSTQKSGAQSETFLVTMTLLHQKGQWLISAVQASV